MLTLDIEIPTVIALAAIVVPILLTALIAYWRGRGVGYRIGHDRGTIQGATSGRAQMLDYLRRMSLWEIYKMVRPHD